jgi:peptidoglycan/LPS O-acetylase OafA/YrhL
MDSSVADLTKQRSKTRLTLTAERRVIRVYPIRPATHRRQTVIVTDGQQIGGTRSFLPAVEGTRACAAFGVVVTHVAFQTGHSSGVAGRLFGRFDLAVAVFFALSGFLLWRGHAAATRDLGPRPPTGHYLRSRVVRIMPAYVVAVVVILCLLPDADHASLTVWLANLTLTQIYVPLTLTGGLTQMWSLSVEVSFYLALPILALLARRVPVRVRVPAIAALGALSWAWGWVPLDAGPGINPLNWPPAFFSWFVAGMLLAEWVHSPIGLPHRLARRRVLMAVVAVLAYLVAASPLAGPEGLIPGTATQFAVKTAMGSLVAFALVAPLVLDRPDTPHRLLGSTGMVTLGRWSYGLFIWHLAALAMVFPVIGTFPFTGRMPTVLVLTLIFGFAIAAVSYALVESPAREALRRWEKRKKPAEAQADASPSQVIDLEADTIAP